MTKRTFGAWTLLLLPVAVYVAWCAWGFNRIGQVSASVSPWQAARDLPKGHQLAASDVARAPNAAFEHPLQSLDRLVGRFLQANIAKSKPVASVDLKSQPTIAAPDPNSLIYFASLEDAAWLQPHLDAGARLTLCWASKECIANRSVIAVSCDARNACVAITSIPVDQLDRMDPSTKPQLLLHR